MSDVAAEIVTDPHAEAARRAASKGDWLSVQQQFATDVAAVAARRAALIEQDDYRARHNYGYYLDILGRFDDARVAL